MSHGAREDAISGALLFFSTLSLLLLVGLLDADEEEVLVGGDEDFLSAGAHSEEGHIVHGVDVAHHRASLQRQVRDVIRDVLGGGRCRRLVPLRDNSALVVHDQQRAHALVASNSIYPLLEVSHFKFSVTEIINLIKLSPFIKPIKSQ